MADVRQHRGARYARELDELFLFVADHTAGAVDAASGEPDQVRRAILPAGGSPVQARWDSRILGVLNVAATSPSWIA